jgi:hypothetical protein
MIERLVQIDHSREYGDKSPAESGDKSPHSKDVATSIGVANRQSAS